MKAFHFIAAMALVGVLASGGLGQTTRPDMKRAADSSNQFGLELYCRLAADQKGNLFFSPYSIETALAMTWAGARGTTAGEMARVLRLGEANPVNADMAALLAHLTPKLEKEDPAPKQDEDLGTRFLGGGGMDDSPFVLVTANALWAQKGLRLSESYQKLVHDNYQARLQSLDFTGGAAALEQSRKIINDWAAHKTNDKIKDVIAPGALSPDTRLVLTNAIYFKSCWAEPFAESATRDEPFHLAVGSAVTTAMLHQRHRREYLEDADVQIAVIPYFLNHLSMWVVLPKKLDGLADVEKKFDAKKLRQWSEAMAARKSYDLVELSLPKFKFRMQCRLAQTLRAMGIVEAFSDKADFSGICTDQGLYISQVIHQTYIDVNEKGTEAAAMTAMLGGGAIGIGVGKEPEPIVFKADHPFLFFIQENESGAILFLGRVANPKG